MRTSQIVTLRFNLTNRTLKRGSLPQIFQRPNDNHVNT